MMNINFFPFINNNNLIMKYNISKLIIRQLFIFEILYYCVIKIITQFI